MARMSLAVCVMAVVGVSLMFLCPVAHSSGEASTGTSAADAVMVDVTGNGVEDLLVYLHDSRKLAWSDTGAASPSVVVIDEPVSPAAASVVVLDVNTDGAVDVAVLSFASSGTVAQVDVYYNSPGAKAGRFGARERLFSHPQLTNGAYVAIDAIDVDKDGRMDIVLDDDALYWYRNEGRIGFVFQGSLTGPMKDAALSVLDAAAGRESRPSAAKSRARTEEARAVASTVTLTAPADIPISARPSNPNLDPEARSLRRLQSSEVTSQGTRLSITFGAVVACISLVIVVNLMQALRE